MIIWESYRFFTDGQTIHAIFSPQAKILAEFRSTSNIQFFTKMYSNKNVLVSTCFPTLIIFGLGHDENGMIMWP